MYSLDDDLKIRLTPESPVINFDQLKTLLLSNDHTKFDELVRIISNSCKFLDEKN